MNKLKCINGHFYNGDMFQNCPVCGSEAVMSFRGETARKPTDGISKTAPLLSATERNGVSTDSMNPVHRNIDELAPTEMLQPEDEIQMQPLSHKEENEQEEQQTNRDNNIFASQAEISEPSPQSSLSVAVEATSSKNTSALPKTMAYYDLDTTEPPVGWLVCIKGAYLGTAFECKVGRNKIGRGYDMDINLMEDTAITREPHAILIYEPQQRQFFIQAGTSDGLAYCNGNLVFADEELHAYDKIALGKSEFIFLPLCGEQFTWDEYITER